MKFGKLPSIEDVNFTLPPDTPGNTAVLAKYRPQKGILKTAAYIGATGWSMKEWVGRIYPKGTKAKDYLHHYSWQFNTIELNATHYHIPSPETIEKWVAQSAADFRFCPKVLQTISHSSDLGASNNLIQQFGTSLEGLREKLGICFIQMPPHFGPDRLEVLEHFLKFFNLPLAVEVRHEGWFNDEQNFERLFSLLEKYGVSSVITDVAGRRDVCHMRLTNGTALVRFVGNGLHPTDFSRIDDWVNRLVQWHEQGLKAVYFFTHEPDNLLAPELAIYLVEKLKSTGSFATRCPVILAAEQKGEQLSLF